MNVALADGRVYISDGINQRIVVVRLEYSAEQLVEAK